MAKSLLKIILIELILIKIIQQNFVFNKINRDRVSFKNFSKRTFSNSRQIKMDDFQFKNDEDDSEELIVTSETGRLSEFRPYVCGYKEKLDFDVRRMILHLDALYLLIGKKIILLHSPIVKESKFNYKHPDHKKYIIEINQATETPHIEIDFISGIYEMKFK